MNINDYENSATGIIYKKLKRLNQAELGSNCPQALKQILNQNYEKEYLQNDINIEDVESRTQKRIKYNKIKDIQEQDIQKKEVIYQKFLEAVDNSMKYADCKLYRAPLKAKTIQLSKQIEESSQWFKEKTKEVIEKDNYMKVVHKFSLQQNHHNNKPEQLPQQIFQIDEQIQQEESENDIENQSNLNQDCNSNHNHHQGISKQLYYLANNFPLQINNYKRISSNKSSVMMNNSKIKQQNSMQTDFSTANQTDSFTIHKQIYQKICHNDFSDIQDQIGKLQKLENEKEAQNIQNSQRILYSKISARNMDKLFNKDQIEQKSKSKISYEESTHSRISLNQKSDSNNIQIQGKNINHLLSQSFISLDQHKNTQQPQVHNPPQPQTNNYINQQNSNINQQIQQNYDERMISEGQSPQMQPKMREFKHQTISLERVQVQNNNNSYSKRPQSSSIQRRPESSTIKTLYRPKSAHIINQQINYDNQIQQKQQQQQISSTQLFAQLGSFPHRSTKRMTIKKGLIKRAQSANPKIQQKHINQDNLFTFIPIKYTHIRQEFQQTFNNTKKSSQGNFFFQSHKNNNNEQSQSQQLKQNQLSQTHY